MKIVDFLKEHMEEAAHIAHINYEMERTCVPVLPPIESWPDLSEFANNGLGVAAFEGDTMLGFLCCVTPFKNAFQSTDAIGVFSPMHSNGTIPENRGNIYARMYQAAGEKWAKAGASSHAVCLYAHDFISHQQFFRYGFGLRCVDAIRGMDDIAAPINLDSYDFMILKSEELPQILTLEHMLDVHMAASPCFILRSSETEDSFLKKAAQYGSRYFVATKQGQIIAYIRAELDGETFICDTPNYLHIKGAFCMPEHRGNGVYAKLLAFLIQELKSEGYTRIGVDFESINPTAYSFWLKHFSAYTYGLVRRIDEHAVKRLF